MLNILLLIVGFIALIKGADLFVDGASSIASYLNIPKMLVALTIVAFGTSAPELAVSLKATLLGDGDIVLGNVIGSNIINVLLILGLSSIINPIIVKQSTIKKELPITILFTILFGILLVDNIFDKSIINNFSRSDGIILLLFFSIFLYYLVFMSKDSEEQTTINTNKPLLITITGLIGIIIGSNLVVNSAIDLAKYFNVSERLISLTIISLGTSLPELTTSVSATLKKESDIAIGNILGSNIFNIGIVIGIPTTIFGGIKKINFNYIDLLVMIISVLLLFVLSYDKKISKKEGLLFILIFIVYYSYILIS